MSELSSSEAVPSQVYSMSTPVGTCMVISNGDAVIACGFTQDANRLLALIHPSLRPRVLQDVVHRGIAELIVQYFDGDTTAIDSISVRQQSTQVRERGWRELCRVRPGETISYGELAQRMDVPRGARAAGQVCARNAASLFVPCHRIVAADGKLNHYAWGLSVKRWLLDFEMACS